MQKNLPKQKRGEAVLTLREARSCFRLQVTAAILSARTRS